MSKFLQWILVAILICSVLSAPHYLENLKHEFKRMKEHHTIGDTSHAFSIAMKLLVAVETLKGEIGVEEPPQLLASDTFESYNC